MAAHTWAGFLAELSSAARVAVHCGTPFVNLLLQMLLLTVASVLVGLWSLCSYRCGGGSLTDGSRFSARLPVTILAALILAYWGVIAFMALG